MRISSPDFVGREAELERLDAALERARAGQASTVMIGAEAGMGKTRLLREHVASARDAGATVLVGGCILVGSGSLALAPVAEVLRQLATDVGEGRFRALMVGPRRWLTRLVPDVIATSDDATDLPTAQVFAAFHRGATACLKPVPPPSNVTGRLLYRNCLVVAARSDSSRSP